jgi:hypothetical protein
MHASVPRLRMFAGPNGSGKSTFKSIIRRELLGIYINPDDIEKDMRDYGFVDLAAYSVSTNKEEILSFFKHSSLLERTECIEDAHFLRFIERWALRMPSRSHLCSVFTVRPIIEPNSRGEYVLFIGTYFHL